MCAINGSTGRDEVLIQKMNFATLHRGPDGSGTFFEDDISLGFNRLAIIDLSERAMQPMGDESNRYVIVFNGEIYNFKELKAELSEYPFTTQSDTEVILAAYSRWGNAAFSRLNGMFAIALWDKKEKRLTLARDVVGVKPLYYHFDGKRLVFSSEIKAILEAGIPRLLNHEALGHYLRLMYVPSPMTMFKDVYKLPQGHTLSFSGGKISIEAFRGMWPPTARPDSYADAVGAVRDTVEAAVARQLTSDRPVGVYLSGGIDSSVVLASASLVHPAIDTFSVGFDLGEGEEEEKFNADSVLAKKTAAHFGATHHEFKLSSEEVLGLFSETVRHLDEPIGNATALAQLYLARQAKPTATVVLTGDGGDELFGGYERYRMALVAETYGSLLPNFITDNFRQLKHAHLSGVDRFAQLMFQKDAELKKILSEAYVLPDTQELFSPDFEASAGIVGQLLRADEKHWLVEEALMRGDKASMGASVEARVPLLDLEVRALAHALPVEYKVTPFSTKRILKDAFKDVLPEEVIHAPKRGWFSPGAKWLRHENFVRFADTVLTPEYAPGVSPLFDFKHLRAVWLEHREKRGYHYTTLFAVLVFLEWAREYKVSL
jgi:asparagine synthase (glutamine-hydrolysing)